MFSLFPLSIVLNRTWCNLHLIGFPANFCLPRRLVQVVVCLQCRAEVSVLALRLFDFVDVEDETLSGVLRCGHLEDAGLQQFLAFTDVMGNGTNFLLQLLVLVSGGGGGEVGLVRRARVTETELIIIMYRWRFLPLQAVISPALRQAAIAVLGVPLFVRLRVVRHPDDLPLVGPHLLQLRLAAPLARPALCRPPHTVLLIR